MIEEKLTAEQLNTYAVNKIESLNRHKYFVIIRKIDKEMSENKNPFSKAFYLSQEDKINEAYGEILVAYGNLRARLKTYISVRKFQKILSLEQEKKKVPGNEILESEIKAEVPELYNAYLVLEGWKNRAENTIRTARSHIYGKDNEIDDTNNDKEPEDD